MFTKLRVDDHGRVQNTLQETYEITGTKSQNELLQYGDGITPVFTIFTHTKDTYVVVNPSVYKPKDMTTETEKWLTGIFRAKGGLD